MQVAATSGRVEVEGTVLAVLPKALYRVGIEGGREVQAHAASGPHINFIRLIVGDRVTVALSPGDFLLYDNHRILHGRTAFRGARWVRGIYFDPI